MERDTPCTAHPQTAGRGVILAIQYDIEKSYVYAGIRHWLFFR
jgi:hypothetical protein